MNRFDAANTEITNGVTLLEASAGTGKTFALETLVVRLLLERADLGIEKILVITFTEAATAELVTRIRARILTALTWIDTPALADENDPLAAICRKHVGAKREKALRKLQHARDHFDEAPISTIHGFCKRVLSDAALECGLPFDLTPGDDGGDLIQRCLRDAWRKFVINDPDLAQLAQTRGWSPSKLTQILRPVIPSPDVRLLPENQGLPNAREKLRSAYKTLIDVWGNGEAMRQYACEATWSARGKTSQLFRDPDRREETCQRIEAWLRGGSAPAFIDRLLAEDMLKSQLKASPRKEDIPPFSVALEAWRNACADIEPALYASVTEEVRARLIRMKDAQQVLGFDDLLHRTRDALVDPERGIALRQRLALTYHVALVDEFQDTDPCQWDIVRLAFQDDCLADKRSLVLVGDPKQAIYAFRGADIHAYLAARNATQDTDRHSLRTNWRSEAGIVNAVNELFNRTKNPFLAEKIEFATVKAEGKDEAKSLHDNDGGRALHWWWLPGKDAKTSLPKEHAESRIVARTVEEIARLISGHARIGPKDRKNTIRPAHIAILVRKNAQAVTMQSALQRAGVPSVIGGAGSVLDSDEASEIKLLLCALARPGEMSAVRALTTTLLWGGTAALLPSLEEDEQQQADLLDEIEACRRLWRGGLLAVLEHLLSSRGTYARLVTLADGERRLTNYRHAGELLHTIARRRRLGPESLLRVLAHNVDEEISVEARELRLETDAEAVTITTLHKSKGLEYGIVFCPFLFTEIEPKPHTLLHTPDGPVIDFTGDKSSPHYARILNEHLSSSLRLLYVGLTRAVHRTYIGWGHVNKAEITGLSHLLGGTGPTALNNLRALVDKCPELMQLDLLDDAPRIKPTWQAPAEADNASPSARLAPADLLPSWRIGSFSGLTDHTSDTPHTDVPTTHPTGFRAFGRAPSMLPRANDVGQCLHDLLENTDFATLPNTESIRISLASYGLDRGDAHINDIDPVACTGQMLRDLTTCEVPGLGFCLSDLPGDRRLNEFEFHLPVHRDRLPQRLAKAVADHASDHIKPYANDLVRLPEQDLHGFLHGYIDLAFERDGRWYVLDWKSNWLGPTTDDYHESALMRSMREHHYVLQYHLYCVALRRWLGWRQPGFDPAAHWGGVIYVYLRGVADNATTGWFLDHPSEELLDALDAVLRGDDA